MLQHQAALAVAVVGVTLLAAAGVRRAVRRERPRRPWWSQPVTVVALLGVVAVVASVAVPQWHAMRYRNLVHAELDARYGHGAVLDPSRLPTANYATVPDVTLSVHGQPARCTVRVEKGPRTATARCAVVTVRVPGHA